MPFSLRPDSTLTGFLRNCIYWLPPAIVALLLTLIYLNPFIGDWDGLDYTIFSLHGRPSSMALGRSLFTLFNFALYQVAHLVFGVGPEHAYLLFKYAVVVATVLAVIACWILARQLTGSERTATLAALLVTLSPIVVIYGGQVMTDVPSILLTAAALAVHVRGLKEKRIGWMLAGAALLGLAVNLRETAGFYLPWLIVAPFVAGWKFDRRTILSITAALAVFVVVALGPFLIWFTTSPAYRVDWYVWLHSTKREAERHPIGLANLRPFLIYFFLSAPMVSVAIPFAAWREWRRRGWTLLLLAAVIGLFTNAMLFFNYSTTINWRYFLTGLPALAPLAADYYMQVQTRRLGDERCGFVMAIAALALVAAVMGVVISPRSNEYMNRLALAKDYDQQLRKMPRDAVVIAGAQTVAVTYWRGIGLGEWDWIGVGAGWPKDLLKTKIDEHLTAGRRVYLDADPRWWLPCAWHIPEIEELVSIEPHFHFRRIAPTVFEIRPLTDESATDQPHLQKLLPAARPEEVSKCFDSG